MKSNVLLLTFGVLWHTCAGGAEEPGNTWDKVLALLGWGKETPLVTRGTAQAGVSEPGALWRLDPATGVAAPLGVDSLLRSPVPSSDDRVVYALTEEAIVTIDIASARVSHRVALPEQHTPAHLLLHHKDQLFALTADGCLVTQVGSAWQSTTCDLTGMQRSELVDRARTCGKTTLGERRDAGPPVRVDIIIRKGRTSRRLTHADEPRINYDPVFSPDCTEVYFVVRNRM